MLNFFYYLIEPYVTDSDANAHRTIHFPSDCPDTSAYTLESSLLRSVKRVTISHHMPCAMFLRRVFIFF